MKAMLQSKGTRLLPAGYGFLRQLRNLWEWWRQSPHTMQWSHRETPSLIKTLAHPGAADKNWPFRNPSTHSGFRPLKGDTETRKSAETTLG